MGEKIGRKRWIIAKYASHDEVPTKSKVNTPSLFINLQEMSIAFVESINFIARFVPTKRLKNWIEEQLKETYRYKQQTTKNPQATPQKHKPSEHQTQE